MYVCNCNGIRQRDVHRAIQSGASTPKAVFVHCDARPQCANCVCEMREMISDAEIAMAQAAE